MSQKNTALSLHEPIFGSALTSLVLELEHLRRMRLGGTTLPELFFELKQLFHYLESVGSARIEGNNTTIAQFIETQLEDRPYVNEDIQEIRNIEAGMKWVDENAEEFPINRAFISELHKTVVNKLTPPPDGEGDKTPGEYRQHDVSIQGAIHKPPESLLVNEYMDELFEFMQKDIPSQYHLIRIAIAHHRFMWIHPFGNGNGRTGRLLTYAMLVQTGFRVHVGQILNPTAVFCIDRDLYHQYLAKADQGTYDGMDHWCTYVLEGLSNEIKKIEKLSERSFVCEHLLLPAINYSLKMKYVDSDEHTILKIAAEKQVIKAEDIRKVLRDMHHTTVSRKIKALRDKKMLRQIQGKSTRYRLSFIDSFLLRGIVQALTNEGYIPSKNM
ncbi:MAG: Fic family protein [Flavobacteriales bacterium]|nr:Fic family protein [Flavobacteriales bacterium]MCB9448192.1 Fic family protein [Flavobacteriales bacterium]